MHSKSVVFPAPFGPMRPTISFSRTSRETESSACKPPKASETSFVSRMTGPSERADVRLDLVRLRVRAKLEVVDEAGGDFGDLPVLEVVLPLEEDELLRTDHAVR